MKAMVLARTADVGTNPLQLRELPIPEAGPGEILVRITVCGICRTDLHVIEGELANPTLPLIPGYQVDGGYAEYALVPAAFAYPIPPVFSDEETAPLLCAGIIGYRALRLS